MRLATGILFGFIGGLLVVVAVSIRWGGDVAAYAGSAAGSTLIAGFGGAAIGAIVGGAISLMLSRAASAETLRRDAAQRQAEEFNQGIRTIATALTLTNQAHSIKRMLDSAFKDGVGEDPFRKLTPFILPNRALPAFAPADFLPYIKAGRASMLTQCAEYSGRVDALDAAFKEYSALRRDWDDFAAAHTNFAGQPGDPVETVFPAGEASRTAKFKASQMNSVIGHLVREAPRAVIVGDKLCSDLEAVFRQRLGTDTGIKLVVEPAASVEEAAPVARAAKPPS